MNDVYINKISIMPPNTPVAQCLNFSGSKETEGMNLLSSSGTGDRFLDLRSNVDKAFEWLSEQPGFFAESYDLLNISTSSLSLSPDEYIAFWRNLNTSIDSMPGRTRFYCGKGCNSYLTSIIDSVSLIEQGLADRIVNVAIELHPNGKPRNSDYAFFSDGVSIASVSNETSNVKVQRYISESDFSHEKYFPYQSSVKENGHTIDQFHTINLFDHINSVKYSGVDSFRSNGFNVHCYSLDPVVNFKGSMDVKGNHLLHAESPPGHVDSLLVGVI